MSGLSSTVRTVPTGRTLQQNARLIAGVLLLAALNGCANFVPETMALREKPPTDIKPQVELTEVPFFPQDAYQCGPAALATVLAHEKVPVTPAELVSQVYVPDRKGSLQVEMLAAPRRHGMVSYPLSPHLSDLLREVEAGNPVIVLQNHGIMPPFDKWHYAVVVGYDIPGEKIILRSGPHMRQVLPMGSHEYVWRKSHYWAMVAVPPDRIPATASERGWLAALADFERVDPAKAREGYRTFLARWPENVDAMVGLANTHYKMGDFKEAEVVLRRAQQRKPQSVVVLNNLAQTLSDQGRSAEALPLAERAVTVGGPFATSAKETRDMIRARLMLP
ncbi:MAG TPA: PA2778 family cysteine peptidase [Burkholderiales bacterium]|nr:PA2778 family cysteine peptidase [Burkholderiales bacterium]